MWVICSFIGAGKDAMGAFAPLDSPLSYHNCGAHGKKNGRRMTLIAR